MLTSVTVKNYRSFVDSTELRLKPLTLVFGQNNSGKSALLRLLPLLADSASDASRGPLDLSSPAIRKASFSELHSRPPLSSRPEIDLRLSWTDDDSTEQSYAISVRSFPELRRNILRRFEITRAGGTFRAELNPDFDVSADRLPYRLDSDSQPEVLVRFSGLVPYLDSESDVLPVDLPALQRRLTELSRSVQWLGSVRSLPDRETAFWGETPPLIQPEGGGTVEVLVADQLRDRRLFPAVSSWFEKTLDLRLDVEARSDRFAVVLSPRTEPTLRVNLLDTGEGITQVLPIVVAIERARPVDATRRLLALEQPELHLHPRAQQALGDYLCQVAAADDPPTLVVETHSENVLLSVQLAILEERISRDAVAIYWISNDSTGRSQAQLLELDERAHPRGWPPEVFRERLEQSRDLVSARLRLGQE